MTIQEELSRQIAAIEENGFGYLGPVLRVALFGKGSKIDWEAVHESFVTHNPERIVHNPRPVDLKHE